MTLYDFTVAKHLPTTYTTEVLLFALFNRYGKETVKDNFLALKNAFPQEHQSWVKHKTSGEQNEPELPK